MDASAFLLGGAVAIGSAMLTLLTDWLKGHFERQRRVEDRRAEFQHATAVELQEILYEIGRITVKNAFRHLRHFQETGKWETVYPTEELNHRSQELGIRGHVLISRIDEPDARKVATHFLEQTGDWAKFVTKENAEKFVVDFPELVRNTNATLGELVRDSWPGPSA